MAAHLGNKMENEEMFKKKKKIFREIPPVSKNLPNYSIISKPGRSMKY